MPLNKRVVIYRAILDSDYSFTSDDVFTVFDGRIMNYSIKETESTATVTMTVAGLFADFERKNGRRTNDTSQQRIFSGDLGMNFSAEIVKDIKWGRK